MYLLKKLLVISMIAMTVNSSNADDKSLVLLKGTSAPYTGVLIPQDQAIQLYNDLHNNKLMFDSYEKSIIYYKQNEELMNKQNQLLLKQNDKLAESVYQQRSTNNWDKFLWFTLGFLSVGMGIYGVKTTSK